MNSPKHHGRHALLLSAKGTCWYCNERLDEIRRFCDKNCAEAFEEDEVAMERRMESMKSYRQLATA